MITIGLVGCGTIGSRLAEEIQTRFRGAARLIGIYDHRPEAAAVLSRRFRPSLLILPPEKLISRCQLLIEAASIQAVRQLLPLVIRRRRSVLIMSTGALLQHPELLRRAIALSIPVYCPSGAVCGLDGIKAGSLGTLRSVTLTTRKPPRALGLSNLRSPRLLFQGPASKAVSAFPQNINVAATLALAGVGPKRTRVRLFADPTIRENIHEVEVVGSFGRLTTRTENRPSKENPKTSELAVLSAVATLKQILQPMKVGT
ncbi:MAG: DUF108 domain-containing protein [Candidatus Omnitrophica bacterium]|nr:DUF108 domain-containing protein [Candidatus Omnitrophota bacterium]